MLGHAEGQRNLAVPGDLTHWLYLPEGTILILLNRGLGLLDGPTLRPCRIQGGAFSVSIHDRQ